jgi:hypothetical protein
LNRLEFKVNPDLVADIEAAARECITVVDPEIMPVNLCMRINAKARVTPSVRDCPGDCERKSHLLERIIRSNDYRQKAG